MSHPFTKRKFSSLSPELQHKKAAELLKNTYYEKSNWRAYKQIEEWLSLSPISLDFEDISARYHFHLKEASIELNEKDFLPKVKERDTPSDAPFLPIMIYLDHLRSAHNIGSILRTVEAFRLGSVSFSEDTPFIDNKKVKDAAMGAHDRVSCMKAPDFSSFPKPLIAIETVYGAKKLSSYQFPKQFSLAIGNEEFGLSKSVLSHADVILEIPLQGYKNSLNVACAFAIVAAEIRRQKDMLCK